MIAYRVRGRWPFPIDMLRFDDAEPATEVDRRVIEGLSGEHPNSLNDLRDAVEVRLILRDPAARHLPFGSALRWKSFSWRVIAVGYDLVTPPEPPRPEPARPHKTGYYWVRRPGRDAPEPAYYDARLRRFSYCGEDQRGDQDGCEVVGRCDSKSTKED